MEAKSYKQIERLIEDSDLKMLAKLSLEELSSRDFITAETLLHVAAAKGYLEIVQLLFLKV